MNQVTWVVGIALALASSVLWAQQPDPAMLAVAMAKNQETLREYVWSP